MIDKKVEGLIEMDVREIHRAIKDGNFEWRKHSLVRLAERQISQDEILKVVLEGEVIDKFESDFKTRRR